MTPATVLGFDYGAKRIGVAAGNTLTNTTTPLGIAPVRPDGPDWDTLAGYFTEWEPDLCVVGMPSHADGSPHRLASAITGFARQLKRRFGITVDTIDERLSSVEAAQRVARRSGAAIDATAAQVILETWLRQRTAASTRREARA